MVDTHGQRSARRRDTHGQRSARRRSARLALSANALGANALSAPQCQCQAAAAVCGGQGHCADNPVPHAGQTSAITQLRAPCHAMPPLCVKSSILGPCLLRKPPGFVVALLMSPAPDPVLRLSVRVCAVGAAAPCAALHKGASVPLYPPLWPSPLRFRQRPHRACSCCTHTLRPCDSRRVCSRDAQFEGQAALSPRHGGCGHGWFSGHGGWFGCSSFALRKIGTCGGTAWW